MQKQQLNPKIPAQALQIIDVLTEELDIKKKDLRVFNQCLNTIDTFIALHLKDDKKPERNPDKKIVKKTAANKI